MQSNLNPCQHVMGPAKTGPNGACIYYQTNDGNYKVIAASFTYWKKKP